MKGIVRAFVIGMLLVSVACGSKSSPTSPSTPPPAPAPTPTRVISIFGLMEFGEVQLGNTATNKLTVQNDGNSPLTVTGLTGTNGITSVLSVNPSNFTVQPGTKIDVFVSFKPTSAVIYTGIISVTADQTSGTNTIQFSGQGSLNGVPVFSKSGTGNDVFTLPSYVNRVRITATPPSNCQNFAVRRNGSLIINTILGTCSV